MKKSIKRFSLGLAASLSFLAVATTGMASAASINNTGPGPVNVSCGSGTIDTTGPGSVNVVGNCGGGCSDSCGNCSKDCGNPDPCDKTSDSTCGNKDCPKPTPPPKDPCCDRKCGDVKSVKVHNNWCWKWSGHSWKWCQNNA